LQLNGGRTGWRLTQKPNYKETDNKRHEPIRDSRHRIRNMIPELHDIRPRYAA